MARLWRLLLAVMLAWAAVSPAADERTPFSLVCDGQKLHWQDGRAKPVMSLTRIGIVVDPHARTLRVEGLKVGSVTELSADLVESQEWLRGFPPVRVARNGRIFPRLSINVNRFTGEVSVASLPEARGRIERPLLHFVGQCERRTTAHGAGGP